MAVSPKNRSWQEWDPRHILDKGLGDIDLELAQDIIDNLLKYICELNRWNKKINLIGPADISEQVVVHLLDALCLVPYLKEETLHFADLGSGGGIPGLVLKIARPGWTGLLVEARAKRCAFLRHLIRTMKLKGIDVHEGHLAPDLSSQIGPSFDLVTMRGFAAVSDILPVAAPLIKPKGVLAAYKGPHYQDELDEAVDLISTLGLLVEKTVEYRLPFLDRKRALLFLRRYIE